jgi:hypothetical protein
VVFEARSTVMLVATLSLATASCFRFPPYASRYAHGERAVLDSLRPGSTLAYKLCRKSAAYAYLADLLGVSLTAKTSAKMGSRASVRTWPDWYGTTDAVPAVAATSAKPTSWSSYCKDLDATGIVYHQALLALRDYATVVESMADAQDYDPSSVSKVVEVSMGVIGKLGATSDVVSTAQSIGAATASLTTFIIKVYRDGELKKTVTLGDPFVQQTVSKLSRYVDALDDELNVAESRRDAVLAAIEHQREVDGRFTNEAFFANVLETATDRGEEFVETHQKLARNKRVLVAIGKAHTALAKVAGSHTHDPELTAALTLLEAEVLHLRDARDQ